MHTVFVDTLNESQENLSHLLDLIDFSKGYTFLNVRIEVGSTIIDALQRANVEIIQNITSQHYYLPKEKALEFDIR